MQPLYQPQCSGRAKKSTIHSANGQLLDTSCPDCVLFLNGFHVWSEASTPYRHLSGLTPALPYLWSVMGLVVCVGQAKVVMLVESGNVGGKSGTRSAHQWWYNDFRDV